VRELGERGGVFELEFEKKLGERRLLEILLETAKALRNEFVGGLASFLISTPTSVGGMCCVLSVGGEREWDAGDGSIWIFNSDRLFFGWGMIGEDKNEDVLGVKSIFRSWSCRSEIVFVWGDGDVDKSRPYSEESAEEDEESRCGVSWLLSKK
jgi:hypothetical protein